MPEHASHRRYRTALVVLLVGLAACDDDDDEKDEKTSAAESAASEDAPEPPFGLSEEDASKVLAKVDGTAITLGDFARQLADQSPYLRTRYSSLERRREFLDNMVRFELLAAEARRKGYFERDDVQRLQEQEMVRQLMTQVLEGSSRLSDVSDEAIKQYYEAHDDEFHKPAQRRVAHILFHREAKARRMLKKLADRPHDMELFRKMVAKHSKDDASRAEHGDLGFVSRPAKKEPSQQVPDPIASAVFELDNTGSLYPSLVRSERGWHIVKLTGRRPALDRSLADARRIIQSKLWRERREQEVDDLVAKLREQAHVEENLELLDDVRIPSDPRPSKSGAEPSSGRRAAGTSGRSAAEEGEPARKPPKGAP